MILQALKDYYDRKAADPESGIAPLGWERKEIPYLIRPVKTRRIPAVGRYERRREGKVFSCPLLGRVQGKWH